jgi:hypothetical protein
MSRYSVVTNSASITKDQRNALTAFFESKGWSVWHWFEDLWLLDNVPSDLSLGTLREEIFSAIPGISQIMIMSTEGLKSHSGQVPPESVPWINEHWLRR